MGSAREKQSVACPKLTLFSRHLRRVVASHAPYAVPPRYKARVKGKGDYVALKKIKLEAEDEGKILSNAPTSFLSLQLSRCYAAGVAF